MAQGSLGKVKFDSDYIKLRPIGMRFFVILFRTDFYSFCQRMEFFKDDELMHLIFYPNYVKWRLQFVNENWGSLFKHKI